MPIKTGVRQGKLETAVFVIDDDASTRDALLPLLRSVQFQAEAFASASQSRETPLPDVPGCLVLDAASGVQIADLLEKCQRGAADADG